MTMIETTEGPSPRLLVVDPTELLRVSYGPALSQRTWRIDWAPNARAALDRMRSEPFDLAIADLPDPEAGGLALLQAVMDETLDVSLVMVAEPSAAVNAVHSVANGSVRFLFKPVAAETLANVVERALQMRQMAQLQREAAALVQADAARGAPDSDAEGRFTRALGRLWIACQPVVSASERSTYGFEAFVRSEEPALENPGALFEEAARLGRTSELTRAIRAQIAETVRAMPAEAYLFVNIHPAELLDPDLVAGASPFAAIADRIVLEITDRTTLEAIKGAVRRVATLRKLGFRVALDDLGSGTVGLSTIVQVEPDLVKLDRSLARGIDTSVRKRTVVRDIVRLCTRELGMQVVCLGVETPTECEALSALGCDLMQGDLFSPPGRGFPQPQWV